MTTSVRQTLDLDPDIAEFFDHDHDALSATVNAILRTEMERSPTLP
jgi:hypothetical protein